MDLLFVKVLLAPVIVLMASLLAQRLGPQKAGFFIGLPTTSLPFTLALWLSLGTAAAVNGAAGGVTGQLTCVLFAIAYSRLAPLLPPLRAMTLSLTIASALAFPTLLLDRPFVTLTLATIFALAGLATWPEADARPIESKTARGGRAVIVRMVAAGTTVALMSSLAPYVGTLIAGALAALPTILIVMGPSVHRAEGAQSAVDLVRGTIATIPGTAAYLAIIAALGSSLGLSTAIGLGLLAIPLLTKAIDVLARRVRATRSKPNRGYLPGLA